MKDAYKNTAALFESALEAVIGTDGEQVVFMNPAAVSALGEHRGEALSSLLPTEALGLVPGQVAALTLCGRRASLRAASAPGLKVFFVAFDEPQKSLPERAGFLPELFQLGLAAVNPNELVRLGHGRHLVNPCQYRAVACQCHESVPLL